MKIKDYSCTKEQTVLNSLIYK